MKLKDFVSVLIFDEQIEIKATTAMFIPKHKQKRVYAKEIYHLIKMVIEKEPLIKIFRFVGTDKTITSCIEKETQSMSLSLAINRIDIFNIIYQYLYHLATS